MKDSDGSTRRSLILGLGGAAFAGWGGAASSARSAPAGSPAAATAGAADAAPGAHFPQQDPELVRSVVGASHFDFDRVRELVTAQPELAKASWDWGFGDWETALGAASHTGRREIAEHLLAHGARPTLFSAAMLGQLAAVRAFVEASPGIQGTPGPHGITLLDHARAGGEAAAGVVTYLEAVGGADAGATDLPLSEEEKRRYLGSFAWGAAAGESFEVAIHPRGFLALSAGDGPQRGLMNQGGGVFHPAGAPSVRFAFEMRDGRAAAVRLTGLGVRLEATRKV